MYSTFNTHTMFKKLIHFVIFLVSCQSINLLYYRQIPVDRLSLLRALESMNLLQHDLDTTFNTRFENKTQYWRRTKLT